MREADEVLDDEDVARVARLRDDSELFVDPLLELRRERAVARDRPGFGHRAELILRRPSGRDVEVRQAQLAEGKLEIDLLRDADRVRERLGIIGKELGHFGRCLHVEVGVIDHLEPIGGVERLSTLDADHHVLRLGILGVDVVDVVRCDEPDAGPP